ncbi:MAG: hypothetical protein RSB35_02490 [Eubacterium sp.]
MELIKTKHEVTYSLTDNTSEVHEVTFHVYTDNEQSAIDQAEDFLVEYYDRDRNFFTLQEVKKMALNASWEAAQ